MNTKICGKCKTEKLVSRFYKSSGRPDGLHGWCKDCHNLDRKRNSKPKTLNKIFLRNCQFIDGYKNQPCADCNQRFDLVAIDFDHVRGEKNYNVGTLRNRSFSLEAIWREIEKCDVVCSNCHRIRTSKRNPHTPRRFQ